MKVSKLLGERFKEAPSDCAIQSHKLMVRGGYMKYVSNGIYSLFTPAKRSCKKIEAIIREEMDRIDGQEVMFPVVMPASLWEESGRYTAIGSEMARFTDRNGNKMVLGMTHEEAAVQLARNTANSYAQYPFMIYQIQTKFRDEPRSRGGLIRVREFTMKDAYSFHTSQKDLERYYKRCYRAYERIYARAGIPEVVAVASDSGMMGGKVSHEFMLLTDIGEDTIVLCTECSYRANMEAAECIIHNEANEEAAPLTRVATYENKTIDEVCTFLHSEARKSCKAVVYQKNEDDSYVLIFVRGDLEVNETKLRNYLKTEVHPAVEIDHAGLVAGAIGPVGLPQGITVVYDRSLEGTRNLICGANEEGFHMTGLNMDRDVPEAKFVDVAKAVVGGVCPKCGRHSLTVKNGIEVGNIFQLGRRYTEAMGMTYDDEKGNRVNPIMGCYGVGVGRLMASVCEEHHDQYGPVWPITIAPWQIQICALRADQPQVKEAAEKLYKELSDQGYEVLYDDRPVSAGFMFSDADLLGAPVRLVVSPKTLNRGAVELTTRDKSVKEDAALENAAERTKEVVAALYAAINEKVPESI